MIKTFKMFLKLARGSALVIIGALSMEVVHIVDEFRDILVQYKAFAISFL